MSYHVIRYNNEDFNGNKFISLGCGDVGIFAQRTFLKNELDEAGEDLIVSWTKQHFKTHNEECHGAEGPSTESGGSAS